MHLLLKNTTLALSGMHLLALCEKLAGEALTNDPVPGNGTKERPFAPKTAEDWLNASQRMRNTADGRNDNVYFNVCGRLLHKDVKVYFSDIGPVWRKGVLPIDLKGLHDRRLLENTTLAVNDLHAWKRTNMRAEPTYQVGAQIVDDPGRIFPDSVPWGAGPVPSWNTLEKSPFVAKAVRRLMQGELGLSVGKDYSRLQHGLPVFVAAIFLAEPSRNIRAWPINLMLLDIAEHATPGFTWGEILWHPLALQPVAHDGPVPGGLTAPVGNSAYATEWGSAVAAGDKEKMARLAKVDPKISRAMGPVTRAGQLHLIGGRMPSSPTKGGEIGGIQLFGGLVDPHPRSKDQRQGVKLSGQRFDYIHQKEIDVLLTWLMTFPDIAANWEVLPQSGHIRPDEIDVGILFGTRSSADPGHRIRYPSLLDIHVFSIRNKITRRIRSLRIDF